jgi:hypothetical protein
MLNLIRPEGIQVLVKWFRDLLRHHNIIITPGSSFDNALSDATRLSEAYATKTPPQDTNLPALYRRAFYIDFLCKATYRALNTKAWANLKPCLTLFTDVDSTFFDAIPRSRERDLVWEYLVGALMSTFIEDISFATPDIVGTYKNCQWGVECKVFYSKNRDHQIDRIVEGAKQLESSSVNMGVIIVHCSNLITHDKYFGAVTGPQELYPVYCSSEVAINVLAKELNVIIDQIDTTKLIERLNHDSHGTSRIKCRGILFVAQTIATVRNSIGPLPVLITMCNQYLFRNVLTTVEPQFFQDFSNAGQNTPHVTIEV